MDDEAKIQDKEAIPFEIFGMDGQSIPDTVDALANVASSSCGSGIDVMEFAAKKPRTMPKAEVLQGLSNEIETIAMRAAAMQDPALRRMRIRTPLLIS